MKLDILKKYFDMKISSSTGNVLMIDSEFDISSN